MRYLLDTNIVIALLDPQRRASVVRRLEAKTPGNVVTSAIVAHELYFGAANSARPEDNRHHFDRILKQIPPLPLTRDDARAGGDIRARLKRAGRPIGAYDVLIAGQALARNMILVTNNSREFSRIDALSLEDWLA